jgi:hypothetical protein
MRWVVIAVMKTWSPERRGDMWNLRLLPSGGAGSPRMSFACVCFCALFSVAFKLPSPAFKYCFSFSFFLKKRL